MAAPAQPALEIKVHRHGWEEQYSDRGTGARQDLTTWRPKDPLDPNHFRVSHTATNSRHPPCAEPLVVTPLSEGCLAKPLYCECVWTDDRTKGSRDGQLWRPVPPPGFVALSDMGVHMDNRGISPGTRKPAHEIDPWFRCVKDTLVAPTGRTAKLWTDAGSRGKYDGGVWMIADSDGFAAGSGKTYEGGVRHQEYKLI
ncbi:unnamed protein product [Symbiodinium natans]|uniref:Uncharacterized protein n=1 Tax=Symbiodinium natans TaxID=878477 RepID=A0A812LF24_9DINO|nr:unnamed protein product [Symbiodinium natans]CAE7243188.1 unnamed protein product [Symbiodinium natans]